MQKKRSNKSHDVTIFDVAQKAGVAISTVSRVLAGSALHSRKTSDAVIQAAKAMRYQPNLAARNLSARTTNLIAVCGWFLGKHEETFPADLVLKGVMQGLKGTRFGLYMVHWSGNPGDYRGVLRGFSQQRFVSGSIWINSKLSKEDLLLVRRSRVPVVQVESFLSGGDCVLCDNVQGGYLGVKQLLGLGRRNIALIMGQASPVQADRLRGCRQAFQEAGISWGKVATFKATGFDYLGGLKVSLKMARARSRGGKIDGVFSLAGDKPALGLIHGLVEKGIRVPENVAVVGYDGMPEGAYSEPALTTVKQPLFKMGIEAARILSDRLEDPGSPVRHIHLVPEILKRRSA